VSHYTIIFATRNKGKQAEILKVARRYNIADSIHFPESDYPESTEHYGTFEGNARQKAQDAARYFSYKDRVLFVGDDSGMEIASLGGAPGVHTRRWGGRRLTDAEFDEYCLLQLQGKQGAERDATLKSTICLLDNNAEYYFYGLFEGRILEKPRKIRAGKDGFPIAALFYVPQADDVLGNIQDDPDNAIKTHRERALEDLFRYVREHYFLRDTAASLAN
jgi:XTP/dITP diphosphohydrolase